MLFADELRNTKARTDVQRKEEAFRQFVRRENIAEEICKRIKPACLLAADKGEHFAYISIHYPTYKKVDSGVGFNIDPKEGKLIKKTSLFNRLLYEETSVLLIEYCNQLGITFVNIRGEYHRYEPPEYEITASFKW